MRNPSRTIPMTPVAVEAAQRIHARSANGVFAHWRLALVILTQLFFYGVPWITIDGRQAVLFDLAHQRFYLFNTLLLPQIRSATLHPQHLDIQVKVDGTPVPARLITAHNDAPPELDAAGSLSLPVTVSLPYEGAQALRGQTVPLRFEVRGTDKGTSEVLASSTFRVPH